MLLSLIQTVIMFLMLAFWWAVTVLPGLGRAATNTLIKPRAIDGSLLSTLNLYEQYSASAYCSANNNAQSGTFIACSSGNCPLVQAAQAIAVFEFENSLLTDVTGFIATDPLNKLTVVSFRGSVSVRNFLTDANFPLIPVPEICDECQVEAGFWQSWSEARDEVLDAVRSAAAEYPNYRLVVTGHSLGGALATVAAAEMRNGGYVVDLATFGSPRVGDTTTANYITAQSPTMGQNFRVTHKNDPVPRLPPTFFGYNHISPEYYIGTANNAPVTANDIQVFVGVGNKRGNGAWLFLDILAHGWYFNSVGKCLPGGIELKA